jgi:hypothetical protein
LPRSAGPSCAAAFVYALPLGDAGNTGCGRPGAAAPLGTVAVRSITLAWGAMLRPGHPRRRPRPRARRPLRDRVSRRCELSLRLRRYRHGSGSRGEGGRAWPPSPRSSRLCRLRGYGSRWNRSLTNPVASPVAENASRVVPDLPERRRRAARILERAGEQVLRPAGWAGTVVRPGRAVGSAARSGGGI